MIRCVVFVSLFATLWGSGGAAVADTGTYDIPEYRVTLTPDERGATEITYYQKWRVTGGHIPWITVGTANPTFVILQDRTRGNVQQIKPANARGWSGVRITLDRGYQPGETFEVEFTVRQAGLFYADPKGYRLDFTPGWYDRGAIGELVVALTFFADPSGVSASPEPTSTEERRTVWRYAKLQPGQRAPVKVVFPRAFFPGEIPLAQPSRAAGQQGRSPGAIAAIVIVVVVVVVLVVVVLVAYGGKGGGYAGGGRVGLGGTGVHPGGCVVSCACACVACACACACAGGGAAGCDRKLTQRCPLCLTCEKDDCPLRATG